MSATMLGAVPSGPSGVRDYGRLLSGELRRSLHIAEAWVENDGRDVGQFMASTARLLWLTLTLPVSSTVIWHYSPFAYSYHGLPGPGILVGVGLRLRRCRVTTILHELAYTCHPGTPSQSQRVTAWAQHAALKLVLLGSTQVVVTTEHRRNQLPSPRPGLSVHVIPVFATIPVTNTVFDPPPMVDNFLVGVLGYSGDAVRPDILVDALASLAPLGGLRIVLIGAPGPNSNDGQVWKRLAQQAGVGECLEFTGVIEPEDFSRHLSRCHIVVLVNGEGPSSRKTTLAVALAHGCPILALDGVNRWEEAIAAGAVRVVPPDPATFAEALAELRDSADERALLGLNAYRFYDAHMSLTTVASKFETILSGSEAQAGAQPAGQTQ